MPAAPSLPARLMRPLLAERLWVTFLWSLALAVTLAAWDWAERSFAGEAAAQRIVLLPRAEPDDAARRAILEKLKAEPGILGGEWIAPADLSRRIAGLFPQAEWNELFPADEAWLTWVLEIRPSNPLDAPARLHDFAARRQQEGDWRMVLWDPGLLASLARRRDALRWVAGCWLALAALGGALALTRLPRPASGGAALLAWSALLGALGPAAVWSAALVGGAEPDARALAIAAGAGFALAAFVAPSLKLPEARQFSLTIGEDPDERIR